MRDDQYLRGIGIGAVVMLTAMRLYVGGETVVAVGPYDIGVFPIAIAGIVVLALPETLDALPFGPDRD